MFFRMTGIIQRNTFSFNEKKRELPATYATCVNPRRVCIHEATRCRIRCTSHGAPRNRHAKFRAAQFRVVQHRNRIFIRVAVVTPAIFGKN